MRLNIYDAAKILGLTGQINPKITKKAYREAAKKYHPDICPESSEEMMKLINEAFDVLKDHTGDVKEQQTEYGDLLNDALTAVLVHQDLVVEVMGAWIWVTGNTKAHVATLKTAGFSWASRKKAWFFRPAQYKSRSRGKTSLDDIRGKYGSVRPGFRSATAIEARA